MNEPEHWETIPGHFNFHQLYTEMVEHFPDGSVFVEVGCYFGRSAAFLASRIQRSGKNIKLVCVDVWNDFDPGQQLYETFKKNMEPYEGIVAPIRAPSITACRFFHDGALDFVFLDADHSYEAVKEDILGWSPKLTPTGILAGHDYSPANSIDTTFEGVGRAVRELIPSFTTIDNNIWVRT